MEYMGGYGIRAILDFSGGALALKWLWETPSARSLMLGYCGGFLVIGYEVDILCLIMMLRLLTSCTVEEKWLMNFFGDDYVQYRAKTKVGIPFIP
jgi:protein-S-isoprenylcysteine O-methyltransferase Ste14